MKIDKTNLQVNISFLKKFEIPKKDWYEVVCIFRQTKQHKVRQMNTKTTYFNKKND